MFIMNATKRAFFGLANDIDQTKVHIPNKALVMLGGLSIYMLCPFRSSPIPSHFISISHPYCHGIIIGP
jgi:hypothetical protein